MYMGLGRLKYITEPLVPDSSAFGVEMAIEKLKRYKSPDIIKFHWNCLTFK
jgi:hypothetical protein